MKVVNRDIKITVSGDAGSGKTYLIQMIAECVEAHGYKIDYGDMHDEGGREEAITVTRPIIQSDLIAA